MTSDRFVPCPGSGAMGIEANRVPAPAGSKRLTVERGLCPLCDRYYTTDRGILPAHSYTKPTPKLECAGQLAMIEL